MRRVAAGAGVVAVVVAWAVLRVSHPLPTAGARGIVGSATGVLAWGLVAAVVAAFAARLARRAADAGRLPRGPTRAAAWAGIVATLVAARLLRDAWWNGVDPWTRLLGRPVGGTVMVETDSLAEAVRVTVAITLLDAVLVVLVARAGLHLLDRDLPVRPDPVAREHVAVGVAAALALAGLAASLAGVLAETAAGLDAALGFVAANPVPVLALVVGAAGVVRRFDARAALALAAALALDATGALVVQDPMAALRLQELPSEDVGLWPTAGAVLALAGLTLAVCAPLLATGAATRAVRVLERRPLVALWLGLGANAVDALATGLGLRTGTVEEANPLVRAGGLGIKVVLVTALLVALHRLRPGLVWVVTTAYLLVVAYHLVGGLLLA